MDPLQSRYARQLPPREAYYLKLKVSVALFNQLEKFYTL